MERPGRTITSLWRHKLQSFYEGKMGNFFPGSVGPRDHLEPKIGLFFKMSRLMVILNSAIIPSILVISDQSHVRCFFKKNLFKTWKLRTIITYGTKKP